MQQAGLRFGDNPLQSTEGHEDPVPSEPFKGMERKEKDFDVFSLKRLCKFPFLRHDKKGQESGPVQMAYQLKKALFGPCDPFPVMETENGKRWFKLFFSSFHTTSLGGIIADMTRRKASSLTEEIIRRFPLLFPRMYAWARTKILPLDLIDRLIPPEGKILDVGSGCGILTLYLALCSPRRQLVGLELDPKWVAIAQRVARGLSQVSFERHNVSIDASLPRNANTVLMIDLLHHIPFQTQEKLLDQSALCLLKGGSLCIREVDIRPKIKFYWNLLHDKIMTFNQPLYFRPSEEFQQALERRGFTVRRWRHDIGPYPYAFLLCSK